MVKFIVLLYIFDTAAFAHLHSPVSDKYELEKCKCRPDLPNCTSPCSAGVCCSTDHYRAYTECTDEAFKILRSKPENLETHHDWCVPKMRDPEKVVPDICDVSANIFEKLKFIANVTKSHAADDCDTLINHICHYLKKPISQNDNLVCSIVTACEKVFCKKPAEETVAFSVRLTLSRQPPENFRKELQKKIEIAEGSGSPIFEALHAVPITKENIVYNIMQILVSVRVVKRAYPGFPDTLKYLIIEIYEFYKFIVMIFPNFEL